MHENTTAEARESLRAGLLAERKFYVGDKRKDRLAAVDAELAKLDEVDKAEPAAKADVDAQADVEHPVKQTRR